MPLLIDKAIQYHCRQGLRTWCDCSFCQAKGLATRKFSHAYPRGDYMKRPWSHAFDYTWHDRVLAERERLRKETRAELNILKQQ